MSHEKFRGCHKTKDGGPRNRRGPSAVTILPSNQYRDPLAVLIAKENAIEKRLKGCNGCARLNFDASGATIIASCEFGRKVGRKGKCSLWKETE